jgi:acetylcholinesterase
LKTCLPASTATSVAYYLVKTSKVLYVLLLRTIYLPCDTMRAQLLLLCCIFTLTSAEVQQPVAKSRAGIFHGRYLPEFEQDLFLGIKYAPKPVRFTPAQLSKDTPKTHYNATQYGVDCTGYGSDTTRLVKEGWTRLGEDCLHLNIVKPRTKQTELPVLLWIYGGGWQQGATSDPRSAFRSIILLQ